MQSSEFLTKLNKNYQSGSSYKSFSTVTITEQGQNIDGKYSFPGNDTALQGLNYPFPTVLTQTDIFGSTVNLHYGRWPRIGLMGRKFPEARPACGYQNESGRQHFERQ